jgi:hypothetical protein
MDKAVAILLITKDIQVTLRKVATQGLPEIIKEITKSIKEEAVVVEEVVVAVEGEQVQVEAEEEAIMVVVLVVEVVDTVAVNSAQIAVAIITARSTKI